MSSKPGGVHWPDGVDRRILAEVDSTNAEAARVAADLHRPTWILALRQLAARGRRGRAWANPPGNFAATLVMRPAEAPDRVALRSFVAALALDQALAEVSGRPEVFTLKWPNDVLLSGGKVAGILLESSGQGGRVSHLSVGIGVNLLSAPAPDAVEQGATSPVSLLSGTGAEVTPQDFLDHLAPAYAAWEARFASEGFAPIRAAWMARAARLGQVIRARTMREQYEGVFEGIDPQGALLLAAADGRRSISAADVFF
ncbi:biotin--[acetyl-CoA-carboxylase] ligase [Brevirhabdus sp.]|uniref:biotin--[acetyl-CoA-carboxylase] ligase n=1 Tax=Brevirhabdus sp. TaxID=2004514 RepID=UPI0040594DFB